MIHNRNETIYTYPNHSSQISLIISEVLLSSSLDLNIMVHTSIPYSKYFPFHSRSFHTTTLHYRGGYYITLLLLCSCLNASSSCSFLSTLLLNLLLMFSLLISYLIPHLRPLPSSAHNMFWPCFTS